MASLIEELAEAGLVERVIPKMEADGKPVEKKQAPPPPKLDKNKGQNIPKEEEDEVDDSSAGEGEAPDDQGDDAAPAADEFEGHLISAESAFRHAIDMAMYAGKKWAEDAGADDAKAGLIKECMMKLKECQSAYDGMYKQKNNDDASDQMGKGNEQGSQPDQGASAKGQQDDLAAAANAVSGGGAQPDQKEA